MLFHYKIQAQKDVHVINMEGELIEKTQADVLLEEVKKAIEGGSKKFILDFSNLRYMNSSGLGILVKLLTKIRNGGGELAACNLNKKMQELLIITKLNQMFHIAESIDKAMEELSKEN